MRSQKFTVMQRVIEILNTASEQADRRFERILSKDRHLSEQALKEADRKCAEIRKETEQKSTERREESNRKSAESREEATESLMSGKPQFRCSRLGLRKAEVRQFERLSGLFWHLQFGYRSIGVDHQILRFILDLVTCASRHDLPAMSQCNVVALSV